MTSLYGDEVVDARLPGKPSKLTQKQKKQLDKILQESPEKYDIPFNIWTTSIVQYINCIFIYLH